MNLRWIAVAPVTVIVTLGLVAQLQGRIDAQRSDAFDQDLLYLPNQHLLTHFTAGMAPVIADMLWLRTLSYTVEEFHGDGRFTWLAQMGTVITRLDPYFVNAYRYTGMFLAALKADDDASVDLLRSGIPHNPTAWRLPYEIGMVYLTNRRDEPDSPALAAQWFQAADATGTAPSLVRETLAGLLQQYRMGDLERSMWEGVLATSTDEFERSIATRKLQELTLRENLDVLNTAAAQYRERTGLAPASWDDLASSGILSNVPPERDQLGGRYFVDAKGEVQNTTLLDLSTEQVSNRIRDRIRVFQEREGRWPQSLDELVVHGHLVAIPMHPYPDRAWQYDNATGSLQ